MIGGQSKKKKIAIISGAGIGIAGIAYISLAANPVAAAAIPAVLAFAACPAMCVGMGGAIWISRRFKKRNTNNSTHAQLLNKNINELETKHASVESNLEGENNKQIVQIQHQYQNKRKARHQDDHGNGSDATTST